MLRFGGIIAIANNPGIVGAVQLLLVHYTVVFHLLSTPLYKVYNASVFVTK